MSEAVAMLQGALLHAEHAPARRPVLPIYHGMQHYEMHLKLRLGEMHARSVCPILTECTMRC